MGKLAKLYHFKQVVKVWNKSNTPSLYILDKLAKLQNSYIIICNAGNF